MIERGNFSTLLSTLICTVTERGSTWARLNIPIWAVRERERERGGDRERQHLSMSEYRLLKLFLSKQGEHVTFTNTSWLKCVVTADSKQVLLIICIYFIFIKFSFKYYFSCPRSFLFFFKILWMCVCMCECLFVCVFIFFSQTPKICFSEGFRKSIWTLAWSNLA